MDIQRVGPEAWVRYRAVRLRSLSDAPDAFGTTFAEDEAVADEHWRERLADPEVATFLAYSEAGDVGIVVGEGYRNRPGVAGLFGMWVAPEARGQGVGDGLVDAMVSWARSAGFERVLLDVGDMNVHAIRLYERKGFVPTGVTSALPPPRDHVHEHERALDLGG